MSHAFIPPDARSTFKYLSQSQLGTEPAHGSHSIAWFGRPCFCLMYVKSREIAARATPTEQCVAYDEHDELNQLNHEI